MADEKKEIVLYEKQLVHAREIGDRVGETAALFNLGQAHDCLGEFGKAINFYEKQLVVLREIGDRRSEEIPLALMGMILFNLGDQEKAMPLLEQALAINQEFKLKDAVRARDKQKEQGKDC
jgi:tetratricopeptide (TPR) repeat protein